MTGAVSPRAAGDAVLLDRLLVAHMEEAVAELVQPSKRRLPGADNRPVTVVP